jgi:hypothetical protein
MEIKLMMIIMVRIKNFWVLKLWMKELKEKKEKKYYKLYFENFLC